MPHSSKEWEDLRKQARQIENDIDAKLLLLAKYDPSTSLEDEDDSTDKTPLMDGLSSASSSIKGVFGKLSREIEALLSRLTEVNNRMAAVSQHIRSPSATYTLQRHRDILNDYAKEFRKAKANVESNHDREQLFFSSSSSNNSNSRGKQSHGRERGGEETRIQMHSKTTDILNKEMESARNSELMVDEQIDTVLRTRESLMNQKAALKAIHSQMTTLANRFPMINSLIQRINLKKRKDTVILASVIGVCLFLLILWTL